MYAFAGRRATPGRESATFEHMPQLALLGTSGDRPEDWLRAGQAMERVLLEATLHGLATSLTSHALEWKDLRELARDPRSGMASYRWCSVPATVPRARRHHAVPCTVE